MAEAGGTEESPWAKGEAAFTRYVTLSLNLTLLVFLSHQMARVVLVDSSQALSI